jgi:glycosyltransferase involved in cell wall biosynthesis
MGSFDLIIYCLNLDHLPSLGPEFFPDNVRRIGFGYLERDSLDNLQRQGAKMVDQLWAPTQFIASILEESLDIGVKRVRLPLASLEDLSAYTAPRPDCLDSTKFNFLTTFDLRSLLSRKNPLGVIEAFQLAFKGVRCNAHLTVKCFASGEDPQTARAREQLTEICSRAQNITLVEETLTQSELSALVLNSDCYISLHRAEGLGLTIAEAMAYGKPVICTGYSGCLDFANLSNSFLVPYKLVAWGSDTFSMDTTARVDSDGMWAEPAIDNAATSIFEVFSRTEFSRRVSATGRESIVNLFSLERSAASFARAVHGGCSCADAQGN